MGKLSGREETRGRRFSIIPCSEVAIDLCGHVATVNSIAPAVQPSDSRTVPSGGEQVIRRCVFSALVRSLCVNTTELLTL